ncbi:hypothetical protein ACHAPY_006495 [Fusarium culmorum]
MDVFAKLPLELVAAILVDLPDLKSLYNVVRASPGVSRFLNSPLGAGILDGLLDSWSSLNTEYPTTDRGSPNRRIEMGTLGVTPWVPYILRLVALFRHCTANNQPTDDLTSFIITFVIPSKNVEGVPELRPMPPHYVPNIRLQDVLGGTQAFSTRELLFLVRKLLVLAGECFDFFLERIKSTRPQHLAKKPSSLDQPLLWGHRLDGQPWGQPYEINAGHETSWYETQRIILGFCGLQLRYEISNAVCDGRLDWPADDIKRIRSMGQADPCVPIFAKSNIHMALEPMWAAAIYVASLKGAPIDSSCVGDTNIERNRRSVFYDTGFQPLQEGHLRLPRPKHEDPSLEWPKTAVRHPDAFYHGKSQYTDYSVVMFGSKGSHWAANILCPLRGDQMTEGLLFRPLRRLGFGIWDDERMAQMQMIDDPNAEWHIPRRFSHWGKDQSFTWASLLGDEEKQELRMFQEALRSKEEEKYR